MKRSGPPPRKARLGRGPLEHDAAPLHRATPMQRSRRGPRTRRPTTSHNAEGLSWAELQAIVRARDACCVGCGRVVPAGELDVHHRRRKGMGGSRLLDRLSNLVALVGPGNVAGCHGRAHQHPRTWAEPLGLYLPDGADPLLVPVRYPDGGWYVLDDAGDRRRIA